MDTENGSTALFWITIKAMTYNEPESVSLAVMKSQPRQKAIKHPLN